MITDLDSAIMEAKKCGRGIFLKGKIPIKIYFHHEILFDIVSDERIHFWNIEEKKIEEYIKMI